MTNNVKIIIDMLDMILHCSTLGVRWRIIVGYFQSRWSCYVDFPMLRINRKKSMITTIVTLRGSKGCNCIIFALVKYLQNSSMATLNDARWSREKWYSDLIENKTTGGGLDSQDSVDWFYKSKSLWKK